jgi:elongation factor 3
MALLEPPQHLLQLLRESLPEDYADQAEDGRDEILSYVSFLAASLAEANEWDAAVWRQVLEPYLANSEVPISANNGGVIETFRAVAEKALTDQDDAESYGGEEDGAEELCDLRFNLAYGGKILLHATKLRLLRGRRYALVGQNGVGKTTLMNAITTGKIERWPSHLKTAYVDSGSNVDPAYELQIVLPHIMESTGKSKEECVAQLKELDFTDSMLEGTIGALSGGWQMKMRLARAVLMEPDIFLLDEPTNHLSGSAVKWITDYLCNLTHQTVLTVSHDTVFLENIATDVIHYEQRDVWGPYRKLVHYKGKMSDFVKLQPQAKHYFELATTDMLKFEFPEPGRLEGVRTSTQKFLELEGVDFRYPGQDKNQLTDINLKMTLSSRVVVLGAVRTHWFACSIFVFDGSLGLFVEPPLSFSHFANYMFGCCRMGLERLLSSR